MELPTTILYHLSHLYGVSMEYIHERYVLNTPSDPKEDIRLLIRLFELPPHYRNELISSVRQHSETDKNSGEI